MAKGSKKEETEERREIITIEGYPDVTETGWHTGVMTEKRWKEAGRMLSRMGNARQWWIGDWFLACPIKDARKICNELDMKIEAVKRAAQVARNIPVSMRRKSLSFSHHQECSVLEIHQIKEVLDWAEHTKASRRQVREKVREIKYGGKDGDEKEEKEIEEEWSEYEDEAWNETQLGRAVVANRHTDANLIAAAEDVGIVVDIEKVRKDDIGWANPFKVGEDACRSECMELYRWYFEYKKSLHDRIEELRGKVLVCSCRPSQCHGDYLADLINRMPPAEKEEVRS